jgi:hypothetical protein
MLAKLSARNQLTLPKRALASLGVDPAPIYFEVDVQDGRIILTLARVGAAEAVRHKPAELSIGDTDVTDIVRRARRHPTPRRPV